MTGCCGRSAGFTPWARSAPPWRPPESRVSKSLLDLIYGLPGQALSQWQESLSAAVDLEPEHLSCYGLKVEEGTPLFARRESADLPDDDAQAEMYLYAVEFLAQYGYRQYEISNFAKPGRESRHNLKYWTLGGSTRASAPGRTPTSAAPATPTSGIWRATSGASGTTPMPRRASGFPPLERDTEWLMLRARTVQGLDPKEFETRFRRRFTCFLPFFEECRPGYAVEEAGCWRLTPKGFLVSNQIIGGLLDALAQEKRQRADAAAREIFGSAWTERSCFMHIYSTGQWVLLFFFYCFCGWVWESCYVSLCQRRWVNRGFLHGPLLPIYGFGAILILFVTLPVENDLRLVWLLGMLAATALEYVVGAAMERLFQVRYWDYSKHRFNLHGYICLSSSIAWGFFSILLVRFVHPPVGRLLADVPSWVVDPLALALTAAFTVDVVRSVQAALDLREMLVKLTEENEDLRRLARRAEIIAAFAEDDLRRFRERTEVDTARAYSGGAAGGPGRPAQPPPGAD